MYDLVGPTLLDLSGINARAPHAHAQQPQTKGGAGINGGGAAAAKEDPIMQARAVACLAAAWPRAPPSSPSSGASDVEKNNGAAGTAAAVAAADAVCKLQRAHAASLTRALSGALSRVVWSVRVPIYGALSAVVSRTTTTTTPESLSPVLTGSLIADVVQAVELGAEDAKYSQVCVYFYVPLWESLSLLLPHAEP